MGLLIMSELFIAYTILNRKVEGQIEQLMRLAQFMADLGDEPEELRLINLAAEYQAKLWCFQAELATAI